MSRYVLSLRRNTLDVDIPAGWPTERGGLLLVVEGDTWETVQRTMNRIWWPGSGYSCHCEVREEVEKTPRRLSDETKQSIRRKALRRRMTKKNPLFAEDAITAAFARNPDYYGGIRP